MRRHLWGPCGLCTAAESCINYLCEALPETEETGPGADATGGDDPVAVCGDGTCDGDETCSDCPADCGDCPVAPECGDGTCNGTETCLTCTADCGECADEKSYYCFELNACLVDGCDPGGADFQTCAESNMGSCQAAAVAPKEWSDWFAWQQCLATCMGQSPTPEQESQCLEYGCPTEVAECFSGGTYGEATCAELDTCMNTTCGAVPPDQQSGCIRDCMSTGTEDAVSQQVAILFCASNACMTETTAAGQQACLQAAIGPDGACADPVSICMGGGSTCEPDCGDKTCGDDGCGGSCGDCADDETCSDAGACEAGTCEPDCGDQTCGDDGCGGSCGECADDETCSDAGACEADTAAVTYTDHTQPIFAGKCGGCHTTGASGGHSIGSSYADALEDAGSCTGLTIAECSLVRIEAGSMPAGKGCGGVVADDADNADVCITESEFATLQAWLDGGIAE